MMLSASLEASIASVLDLLGETEYTENLNVFYLGSRGEMESIVGRPYSGFADWSTHSIFLVLNPEWRSFERHEFAHIVTMGSWGAPSPASRWMIEGVSVYCDGWCQDYSVLQIAYTLLKDDELPGLRELFEDYVELGEIKAGFSSASFISYIADTYGSEMLRELWHGGTEKIEDILGDEMPDLEKSWKKYIRESIPEGSEVDFKSIEQNGCG